MVINQLLDPYRHFGRLRALGRVVRIHTAFAGEAWIVTRHRDVQALAVDPRLSVDHRRHAGPALRRRLDAFRFQWTDGLPPHVGTVDPPDHSRLRRLISQEFTPGRVEALAPRIEDLVNGFLDAAGDGPFDLIADLAEPLPALAVATLLGMNDEDALSLRPLLRELTRLPVDDAAIHRVEQARQELVRYVGSRVLEKHRTPDDGLLGALARAREDDRLSAAELTSMAAMLFAAGAETTTHVIGSGILLLLRHPDQRDMLVRNPHLVPAAVEEFLRYESPVTLGLIRYAADDIEIGGTIIPRGDLVFLGVATANHDDERFPEPTKFDVERTENAHVTFGHGIHYCLGAPLARLELRITVSVLLERFPGIRLGCPVADVPWQDSALRGPAALPLLLGPDRGRRSDARR
ncbi:cytochrome P450 [Streptomyces sp. NPDC048278]|uniref:cytochrome P450 family protein n=1 Tax=Streptomyces sp. NPDC048278 TaxID=3155809 RepID=UPI0034490F18